MQKKPFRILVSAKIKQVKRETDSYILMMDKGILTCYNPIVCYINNHLNGSRVVDIECIQNEYVCDIVYVQKICLRFYLTQQKVLELSLKDDDYAGPEAACLYTDSGELIVL